jgi:transcriptional regulator with XRE-family HTH domain
MEDPEYRRLYVIEALVTDAAELVAQLMKTQGVSKAELARRLGKSRAWVTQLLSGKANMTLRTFADVVYLLGAEAKLSTQPHMGQHGRTSPSQSWALAFNTSRLRSIWTVCSEVLFAVPGSPACSYPKLAPPETVGRLELAA